MAITSLQFIVFCIILTVIYFILPGSWQWILLLGFSIWFYTRSGYAALLFLLVAAMASYAAGLWMERELERSRQQIAACEDRTQKAQVREASRIRRRRAFILLCFLIFGIWIVTKYSSMILNTISVISSTSIQKTDTRLRP